MRDERIARLVSGVVTLSTPFIHVTPRVIPTAMRRILDRQSRTDHVFGLLWIALATAFVFDIFSFFNWSIRIAQQIIVALNLSLIVLLFGGLACARLLPRPRYESGLP